MSGSLAGFMQVGLLVVALAVCYKPLGNYIARVVTSIFRIRRVTRSLPNVSLGAYMSRLRKY